MWQLEIAAHTNGIKNVILPWSTAQVHTRNLAAHVLHYVQKISCPPPPPPPTQIIISGAAAQRRPGPPYWCGF